MRYALFLLAAAIATPALAAQEAPAAPEQAAEKKQKKPKEKRICRENYQTASRMGSGRTCLTAAQWAERDRKSGHGEQRGGGSRSGRSASAD